MKRTISRLGTIWGLLLWGLSTMTSAQTYWQADILPHYRSHTIELQAKRGKALQATIVRHDSLPPAKRALLYVHGYNDYFFQSALGDSLIRHGYRFYALDLRRYGRSLRPGQDAFSVQRLSEYYEELDSAFRIMKQEGAEDLYLMAHSTGGLITSLYLNDRPELHKLRGFILNSPFLDFNFPRWQERTLIPILSWWGQIVPSLIVSGRSKEVSMYARSLQSKYEGQWTYNSSWKKDQGHPIRLSWLRAIRRGHKQVQRGLNLEMPILLMSSDSSIRAQGKWQADYGRADLVLDVEDIQRYGQRLGSKVEAHRLRGGLHDLFLSSDSTAYAEAYRLLFDFLDRTSGGCCITRHSLRYLRHSDSVIYTSKLPSTSVLMPCEARILQSPAK